MKFRNMLSVVFVLALALAACAPQATSVPTRIAAPTTAPTEPAATETSVATEPAATNTEEAATPTGAAETATAGIPVTGEATLNVSESTEYGTILVDGDGYSLYIFMADTQNGDSSACGDDDGCTAEWPPVISQGSPIAGEGVDSSMLGTITRDDGSIQVTYNGWPLYRFHDDTAAGDTNGEGLEEFGGLWYLVNATGEAVKE
jgi:predicted lipoprotein with Yx(FWY)xxD motif